MNRDVAELRVFYYVVVAFLTVGPVVWLTLQMKPRETVHRHLRLWRWLAGFTCLAALAAPLVPMGSSPELVVKALFCLALAVLLSFPVFPAIAVLSQGVPEQRLLARRSLPFAVSSPPLLLLFLPYEALRVVPLFVWLAGSLAASGALVMAIAGRSSWLDERDARRLKRVAQAVTFVSVITFLVLSPTIYRHVLADRRWPW